MLHPSGGCAAVQSGILHGVLWHPAPPAAHSTVEVSAGSPGCGGACGGELIASSSGRLSEVTTQTNHVAENRENLKSWSCWAMRFSSR